MLFDSIEKLKHVLKMNEDVMTDTGITYIKDVIKDIENTMEAIENLACTPE